MGLYTPVGELRLFLDGKPLACKISEMKIRDGEALDGKYRMKVQGVHVENNGKPHMIMCVLRPNQAVERVAERGSTYAVSSYYGTGRKLKLSVGLKVHNTYKKDSDGNEIRIPDYDYDGLYYESDGLCYDMYDLLPETKTEDFVFGAAWCCDHNEENDAETLVGADPSDMNEDEILWSADMFDANDIRTQDYGIWKPDFYRYAVDGGNFKDMVVLGDYYRDGMFVKKDPEEAVRWYKKAADAGVVLGIYDYAWCLDYGCGLEQDPEKAFRIYTYLIDNKTSYAGISCRAIGKLYENGKFGEVDLDKALEYYNKAWDLFADVDDDIDRIYRKKEELNDNDGKNGET